MLKRQEASKDMFPQGSLGAGVSGSHHHNQNKLLMHVPSAPTSSRFRTFQNILEHQRQREVVDTLQIKGGERDRRLKAVTDRVWERKVTALQDTGQRMKRSVGRLEKSGQIQEADSWTMDIAKILILRTYAPKKGGVQGLIP